MNLEGKVIEEVIELPGSYSQVLFEDGTFIIVKSGFVNSEDLVGIDLEEKEEEEKPTKAVPPKKAPFEEEEVEEEEEEEEEGMDPWTEEELEEMNRESLIDTIDEEELDIDPDDPKYRKTSALRKALIDELVD